MVLLARYALSYVMIIAGFDADARPSGLADACSAKSVIAATRPQDALQARG
jgi:hypothetical protein